MSNVIWRRNKLKIESKIGERKLAYKSVAQNHEYHDFFRRLVYFFSTLPPYKMKITICVLVLALLFAFQCKLYSFPMFLICLNLYISYYSDCICGWRIWLWRVHPMLSGMQTIPKSARKSHLLCRLHGNCNWKVMDWSVCVSYSSIRHVDRACITSVRKQWKRTIQNNQKKMAEHDFFSRNSCNNLLLHVCKNMIDGRIFFFFK
jgi:hypothetical protein